MKEKAIDFLKKCAAGHSRVAFELYVSPNFKHHNPGFKGDAKTLMEAMEKNAEQNPDKTFEVLRAVAEENLVMVHSRVSLGPDKPDIAVSHIFRFNNGKIEELWDIGRPVPEDSPNENGMF